MAHWVAMKADPAPPASTRSPSPAQAAQVAQVIQTAQSIQAALGWCEPALTGPAEDQAAGLDGATPGRQPRPRRRREGAWPAMDGGHGGLDQHFPRPPVAPHRQARRPGHGVDAADLFPARPAQDGQAPALPVVVERCTSLIRVNDGDEWPFAHAIHPYRIEAAPSAPGGLRIVAKLDAAERLRLELRRPAYRPRPLCLGSIHSDAYQPAERTWRLTRGLLEVLGEARLPLGICTGSAGLLRDLDLLADLARQQPVFLQWRLGRDDVGLSPESSPAGRATLERLRRLARAGLWVGLRLGAGPGNGDGTEPGDEWEGSGVAGGSVLSSRLQGAPVGGSFWAPGACPSAETIPTSPWPQEPVGPWAEALSAWISAGRQAGVTALGWSRRAWPEAWHAWLAEQAQAAGLLTGVPIPAPTGFAPPAPPLGFEVPRQARLF